MTHVCIEITHAINMQQQAWDQVTKETMVKKNMIYQMKHTPIQRMI